MRHYERVLTVDPKNLRAAEALVPIYKRAEKWSRLVGVPILVGYLALALESLGVPLTEGAHLEHTAAQELR